MFRHPNVPSQAVLDSEVNRLLSQGAHAMEAGQFETAGRVAEAATRLDPRRREPWGMLCAALEHIGSADAPKAMAKAIANFPENDPFRTAIETQRAGSLIRVGLVAEGVEQAKIAASRHPIEPTVHQILGATFCKVGLYDEALSHAEQAVTATPDEAGALYNLATVYRFLGRFDEAEAAYERGLTAPRDASTTLTYSSLASLRKWTAEKNHVESLRAAIVALPADSDDVAPLNYALFKELNDLGQYDQAWDALTAASAAVNARGGFSGVERRARADALIAAFPEARLRNPAPQPPSRPRPIFIVGLPRSGTTLVERIFSAHSRVTAMGETTAMGRAVKTVAKTPGRDNFDLATINASAEGDPAEIARLYLHYNAYLADGADVVTEKLPHNYEYVGYIRTAFPDATIVHVRRSPMDSLFGAYRLQFGENAFWWSYSLEGLAENYRIYRRLSDHWRAGIGEDFFEITLEDLIADPEAEIRRLLAGAGLDFEEACLSPEKAEGGVSTASSSQIRTPINSQGVGTWRKYGRHLEPLRAALERDGFVDQDGNPVW